MGPRIAAVRFLDLGRVATWVKMNLIPPIRTARRAGSVFATLPDLAHDHDTPTCPQRPRRSDTDASRIAKVTPPVGPCRSSKAHGGTHTRRSKSGKRNEARLWVRWSPTSVDCFPVAVAAHTVTSLWCDRRAAGSWDPLGLHLRLCPRSLLQTFSVKKLTYLGKSTPNRRSK